MKSTKAYLEISGKSLEAIHRSFEDITVSEPQLVANLVFNIAQVFKNVSLSNHVQIKAGGIFVHQVPLVRYFHKIPKTIELGDLLLLRSQVDNGKVVDRRAMLLQAKKIKNGTSQPSNKAQNNLYTYWPEFEYVKSGALNGQKRHIVGLDIHSACKYLLIQTNSIHSEICCNILDYFFDIAGYCRDINIHEDICGFHHDLLKACCCSSFQFTCSFTAQPTQPLSYYRNLVIELTSFILGDTGKTFSEESVLNDCGWNQVIYDLIHSTAKLCSVYTERASQRKNASRGQFLQKLFCTATDSTFLFGGLDSSPPFTMGEALIAQESVPVQERVLPQGDGDGFDSQIEDENRGISIIHFRVGSQG